MMRSFFGFFLVWAMFSSSFACDIHGKTGFAPKNTINIPVGDKSAGFITERDFVATMDKVSSIYAPIVAEKGGILTMVNKWTNGEANAHASKDQLNSKIWYVTMYGGLARHPLMTIDAFTMIICHEIGHHIGGAPIIRNDWGSNEGQADYFASTKCLRRVMEREDNLAIVGKLLVDPTVRDKCEETYHTSNEVAICKRIGVAAKVLGMVLSDLSGTGEVDYNTPDTNVVMRTFDDHPAPQCRLDTYFQGALCDKSPTLDFSKTDPAVGACIKRDGYKAGMRSKCWYRPKSHEI